MEQLPITIPAEELKCHCNKCGLDINNIDPKALQRLELLKILLGEDITVTSACRCESWNRLNGGVTASRHLATLKNEVPVRLSDAFDILTPTIEFQAKVYEAARGAGFLGFGHGHSFLHVDCRPYRQDWTYAHK